MKVSCVWILDMRFTTIVVHITWMIIEISDCLLWVLFFVFLFSMLLYWNGFLSIRRGKNYAIFDPVQSGTYSFWLLVILSRATKRVLFIWELNIVMSSDDHVQTATMSFFHFICFSINSLTRTDSTPSESHIDLVVWAVLLFGSIYQKANF